MYPLLLPLPEKQKRNRLSAVSRQLLGFVVGKPGLPTRNAGWAATIDKKLRADGWEPKRSDPLFPEHLFHDGPAGRSPAARSTLSSKNFEHSAVSIPHSA
jgi:hypothetical protein